MLRSISILFLCFLIVACDADKEILLSCSGTRTVASVRSMGLSPAPAPRTEPFRHTFRFFQAIRPVHSYDMTADRLNGSAIRPDPTPKLVWIMQQNGGAEEFERRTREIRENQFVSFTITVNVSDDLISYNYYHETYGQQIKLMTNTTRLIMNRIDGRFENYLNGSIHYDSGIDDGQTSERGTCERVAQRRI